MAEPIVKPPLSVAIICRDNEATIARTLESVKPIAAEIVALDSGSTDRTVEILRQHGATVHDVDWPGHIAQKNRALEACGQPWILSIDSDESLDEELRGAIERAVHSDDGRVAAYELNRKVWWMGEYLHHAWQPEWRCRLVRRGMARWGGFDPHDKLEPTEAAHRAGHVEVRRLEGVLRHDAIPGMRAFLARQVEHSAITTRAYMERGRTTSKLALLTSPIGAWSKQMIMKQAWRDGWRGWCAASAVACAAMMKHIMLLEAQHERRLGRSSGRDS